MLMNKPVVGIIAGAVLGLIDGMTAWFTPEVRPAIAGILLGSTFKGMAVGVLAGWFARKVRSLRKGILVGAMLGLFFAFLIALAPQPSGNHYWLEIMLPGFITGGIIGFLTQRIGPAARTLKNESANAR